MGGVTIPLVALDAKPPASPDLLEQYGKLMSIQGMQQQNQQRAAMAPLQQQEAQQSVQQGALDNQMKQQQMQDSQTLRSLSPNYIQKDPSSGKPTGYDYDGLFNAAAAAGVSVPTLTTLQKSISDATLARANSTKSQLENESTLNTEAYNHIDGVRGLTDPAQRQQAWQNALQWAQTNGSAIKLNPQALPQQAPDDTTLSGLEASLGMHAQQINDASKKATILKDTGQGNEANAAAASSLLKQYSPTLAQSATPQEYATKLQAFETLHPDLAGRFPQQFDPKNPQPVLNAGMSASEVSDSEQKDRLTKYEQANENYRAQIGRQTSFQNTMMQHGYSQIDQYTADPQHGYGQFVSQASAVKNAIQDAKNGNQVAASMEPLMLALGVSSFAGVHRINTTEIDRAGPQVGSVFRKINNLVDTIGTGVPSAAQLNEANGLVDSLTDARHKAYLNGVSAVAANTGLDPSKIQVFDRDGNLAPLSSLQPNAGGPPRPRNASPLPQQSGDPFAQFGGKAH